MPRSNNLDPDSEYYEKKTIITQYPDGASSAHNYWVRKNPVIVNVDKSIISAQVKEAVESSPLRQYVKDVIENTIQDDK